MKHCKTFERVRLMVLDAGLAMSDGHLLHLSVPDSDSLSEEFYNGESTFYDKGPKYNNEEPWYNQVTLDEFRQMLRRDEPMVFMFMGVEIQWFCVGATTIEPKALIQFEPIAQVSEGGIILNEDIPWPGAEEQDYRFGIVLAIGPGRITRKGVEIPAEFNVGDRVLVANYHTTSTGLKDRHFCGHKDVLAVLEDAT